MRDYLVLGAGPAGLTAATTLKKMGLDVVVAEASKTVGGLARTVERHGYRFDVGGHRFYTQSQTVMNLWKELLPDDLLVKKRKSRIRYNGKFFEYPLEPLSALKSLGVGEAARCVGSYVFNRKGSKPQTFEQWVSQEFGPRLYEVFFRSYTEKVWGMPCDRISADWARQRIQGFSLGKAIKEMALGRSESRTTTREFVYPRLGPGMMWEAAARELTLRLEHRLCGLTHRDGLWEAQFHGQEPIRAHKIISTIPLPALVQSLGPDLPGPAHTAVQGLRYRDFLMVGLMLDAPTGLSDQWIYVHDPSVVAGRVQNIEAWSEEMVPRGRGALALEYFCNEGEALWQASDHDLGELALAEARGLGLIHRQQAVDTLVIRQRKAYPVYDEGYASRVKTVLSHLESHCPGLRSVGRNGLHRYNNQDHSMLSALQAVAELTGQGQAPGLELGEGYLEEQLALVGDLPQPKEVR